MHRLKGDAFQLIGRLATDWPDLTGPLPSAARCHDDGKPVVVLLSGWHPEPIDNGAKQRLRMFIKALERHYTLVLISLLPSDEVDPRHLPRVPGVRYQYALPLPEYRSGAARSIIGGLSLIPRSLRATWDGRIAHAIQIIASWHRADLAIGFDLRLALYLASLSPRMRTILDEPNVSPYLVSRDDLVDVRAHLRAWKHHKLISQLSPRINTASVPSYEELHALRRFGATARVEIVENAVPELPLVAWQPPEGTRILYTGSLTYQPNAAAVDFFTQEVLPRLRTSNPAAELVVTGTLPAGVAPGLLCDGLRLTGRLPELEEQFRSARLFVVPLLEGTGTRIKLLEAMAHGLPIVSTTKGAEGLPVEHGEHLLIADDAGAFTAACRRLLEDDHLSQQLGTQARALVEERFTWQTQIARIRSMVSDLISPLPTDPHYREAGQVERCAAD